jgi:hypothetical protein
MGSLLMVNEIHELQVITISRYLLRSNPLTLFYAVRTD